MDAGLYCGCTEIRRESEMEERQMGRRRSRKRKKGRQKKCYPAIAAVVLLTAGVVGLAGHHLISSGMEENASSQQSALLQQSSAPRQDESTGTDAAKTESAESTAAKEEQSQQGDLITEGEKPVSERDTTPLLGGAELRMLQSQTKGQMMSFLLKTKSGKLIVVDGGRWDDGDYLMEQIKAEGGHVSAWFLTHAHTDHVGALLKLLTNESDGVDTGITIDHIYYNFASVEWYEKHELGDLGTAMSILQQLAALPVGVCQTVKRGDEISVDDVVVQVMNDRYEPEEVGERDGNDASMAYRMIVNGKSILFLGDLQKKGGEHLLEQAGGGLKSDMVQMAHHGQNGVNEDVYDAIDPSICLWPTPQWLWDNEGGSYTTPETKEWVKKLNVKRNYCTKDGDQVIR